ncbi:hypothetical protein ILUMI_04686 [Ignelater luminosus]|uniref:Transposable element P transposase-like RNase H domain-containing protein n=1 Tax=Ignelater luminosus TaxID=2038154 RepID=A0A8K0DE03_IGNLU|nr:hypothetical protein ILUMI_04686 [Ignelater luminosus]
MDSLGRQCVVLFDEITLKRELDYNKHSDYREGFEDFGKLGRTAKFGNQGLHNMHVRLQSPVEQSNCEYEAAELLELEELNIDSSRIPEDDEGSNKIGFEKAQQTDIADVAGYF